MKIINGKKIANEILSDLKKKIKKQGITPCLSVILVGNDPSSHLYVKMKEKVAQSIGVEIRKHVLSAQVSEEEILKLINSLNKDSKINGILVQMPLPENISLDRIIQAILPEKDVDGFLLESKFELPFILAIYEAIKSTKEDLKNKKILALVNSDIFGEKMSSFFIKQGLNLEYRLEVVDEAIGLADVLITALGQLEIIKENMIKQDAILIDGGISKKNGKIIGDIDVESVKKKAKWISPVPGGIGPLTVAFLMKNIIMTSRALKKDG